MTHHYSVDSILSGGVQASGSSEADHPRGRSGARWSCLIPLIALALLAAPASADSPTAQESAPSATIEAAPSTGGVIVGKVTETIEAGRYTYVEVDVDGKRVWAAGPQVQVKVGDSVSFPARMPMADFVSRSLDRKFDLLYMVNEIRVASGELQPSESPVADPPAATRSSAVEPLSGGYTVAQIFEQRVDLAGQEVDLRGRVVKFNRRIMGRNWAHVQDGTVGPGGADDLVVTTDSDAEVGSIVVVHGTVVTDKDFGSGYAFDVLIEEASLTIE